MAISLANIATGRRMKPPKIVIYGTGGIGKTTFASESPNPIFLCTEEGQGLLDIPRFELRQGDPLLRTWQEILDCVEFLRVGDHKHQTVVLDTFDFAEPLLWSHVCNMVTDSKGRPASSIEDYGYGKGYGYAVDYGRVLLRGFDMLRNERGMAVILIAHAHVKKFDAPDLESYDRYQLKLQERLANLVFDWSDCVLFAAQKKYVTKDREGFNQERRRAIGQGDSVLYTQERPAFMAKNRYALPPELPFIHGRSWHDFVSAINTNVTKVATPTQAPATASPPPAENQPQPEPQPQTTS